MRHWRGEIGSCVATGAAGCRKEVQGDMELRSEPKDRAMIEGVWWVEDFALR